MNPPCPITGEPAQRLVQNISTELLTDLWKYGFRVDTSRAFTGEKRIGMWESPCGLIFFEPRTEGDGEFYRKLYRNVRADYRLYECDPQGRIDFRIAAEHIRPGDKVLEIGPGAWGLKPHVPHADYLGLEPHLSPSEAREDIVCETIEEHARKHPDTYDVVCAFHVIEHVADPLLLARQMVAALRPGGLLILAGPTWPSPITDIPNYVLNAPPHHLTWWNPRAFSALSATLGLEEVDLREIRGMPGAKILLWMRHFSPVRTDSRYFRHSWKWHLSLLYAALLGGIAERFATPPDVEFPMDIISIARKPSP